MAVIINHCLLYQCLSPSRCLVQGSVISHQYGVSLIIFYKNADRCSTENRGQTTLFRAVYRILNHEQGVIGKRYYL